MNSPQKLLVSETTALEAHGQYFARVGLLGQIGRFLAVDSMLYGRGERVICRTARGIESAEILGPLRNHYPLDQFDGQLLRRFTVEDKILWSNLSVLASEARDACQAWLEQRQLGGLLIDVEPLLDGRTLYFHFLADVPDEVQQHIDGLASVYERQVRKSKFAQLLESGCGPGCGTAEAKNGCGTRGGCAVCQIAKRCSGTISSE